MTRMILPAGAAILALATGCASNNTPASAMSQESAAAAAANASAAPNTLTPAEQRAGWRLLFDGRTLAGWRAYKADTISPRWSVIDGAMTKSRPSDDLVTRDEFGDFELVFDWKVSAGGNAGVFVRATEEYPKVYWSATEYQLLDDAAAPDGRNPLTSAGAAYGLYHAPRGAVKPANEWNTGRIVARGSHIEHWLNGQKTAEYEAWSDEWKAKVKASKFNEWPNYGLAKRGRVAIQGDHGGVLALRNIKIRELR
jgi:hypothetical protein